MKVLRLDQFGTLREVNVSGDYGSVNFFRASGVVTTEQESAGFIDLLSTPIEDSISFQVSGVTQTEGVDYTVSVESGQYRIVFVGDLAASGVSAITEGDDYVLTYSVNPIVPTVEFRKLTIEVMPTDIINQYVTIPDIVLDQSEKIVISGLLFTEGVDYTLENAGYSTKLHFTGGFGSGGIHPLEVGDQIDLAYAVNV